MYEHRKHAVIILILNFFAVSVSTYTVSATVDISTATVEISSGTESNEKTKP